ncbi:ABC transporter substrate-binding protein [Bradyrhizobium sp. 1.29L]
MNRREVLTGAAKLGAALSVSAPFVLPSRARAETTLVFAGWGGSLGDAEKELWLAPFTAETGISVQYINTPDMAKVKAQVTTGNVEWDVIELNGSMAWGGEREGLWEPVDTKIVDRARFNIEPPPFFVPTYGYALGIAYDPSRTKPPANDFPQLWDVKNFPGRRALNSYANGTLELALLADGVPPNEVYPLDVERAFRALDRIKPFVRKWFAASGEGTTLIQTNEADYTYTSQNRVKAAKDSGVSIDLSFGQNVLKFGCFSVLKGTKRKEAAMRFLEFVTRNAQQAAIGTKLGFSPMTKGAERLVSDEAKRWFPNPDNPKSLVAQDKYWAEKDQVLEKRFKEWILS